MNETWQITHIPLKRIFDIIFSLLVLSIGAPLFLFIAIAIRLGSKGPIFYSQQRIGRGGRFFKCYKFRTMYPDADMRLNDILKNDPAKNKEWEETRKLKDDPRVTPIGAFLRKTSLDELPQFWNVFKGDLSVVGPRPVMRDELIKYFGERAQHIFSVRPGITGLWQVSGRSDTSYSLRLALDEEYVKTRTFFMDLKLILLTIPGIIFRKGAY